MRKHNKLIDDLVVYFDLKQYDQPTEQETHFYTQLSNLRKSIENGNTEIATKSEWWIFWRGKQNMSVGPGTDEASAMNGLGYGAGAIGAVDFIQRAPVEWDLLNPITLPDHYSDNDQLLTYYGQHIRQFVAERMIVGEQPPLTDVTQTIKTDRPLELVRILKRLCRQQDKLAFLYRTHSFTPRYRFMSDGIMAEINQYLMKNHKDIYESIDLEDDE